MSSSFEQFVVCDLLRAVLPFSVLLMRFMQETLLCFSHLIAVFKIQSEVVCMYVFMLYVPVMSECVKYWRVECYAQYSMSVCVGVGCLLYIESVFNSVCPPGNLRFFLQFSYILFVYCTYFPRIVPCCKKSLM